MGVQGREALVSILVSDAENPKFPRALFFGDGSNFRAYLFYIHEIARKK